MLFGGINANPQEKQIHAAIQQAEMENEIASSSQYYDQFASENGVQISYVAGTIDLADQNRFRTLIFRVSRGQVLSFIDEQTFEVKDSNGRKI